MKQEEYPAVGDLVVCKVKTLKDYGVFVDLQEYQKEGFIHVSNIASGWVKNIRSHVSEGQIRVAQVVRIDKSKNVIDVSLRKVSQNQEKRKMSDYKRATKAEKLLERVARQLKADPEKTMQDIGFKLVDEFGDLFSAFEAASVDGAAAFKELKLDKKWVDAIVELAKASVSVPSMFIKGTVKIMIYNGDGLDTIKSIAKKLSSEKVLFSYKSAPDYSLSIEAEDYPKAEKILKSALDTIESDVKKVGGDCSFERQQK